MELVLSWQSSLASTANLPRQGALGQADPPGTTVQLYVRRFVSSGACSVPGGTVVVHKESTRSSSYSITLVVMSAFVARQGECSAPRLHLAASIAMDTCAEQEFGPVWQQCCETSIILL